LFGLFPFCRRTLEPFDSLLSKHLVLHFNFFIFSFSFSSFFSSYFSSKMKKKKKSKMKRLSEENMKTWKNNQKTRWNIVILRLINMDKVFTPPQSICNKLQICYPVLYLLYLVLNAALICISQKTGYKNVRLAFHS